MIDENIEETLLQTKEKGEANTFVETMNDMVQLGTTSLTNGKSISMDKSDPDQIDNVDECLHIASYQQTQDRLRKMYVEQRSLDVEKAEDDSYKTLDDLESFKKMKIFHGYCFNIITTILRNHHINVQEREQLLHRTGIFLDILPPSTSKTYDTFPIIVLNSGDEGEEFLREYKFDAHRDGTLRVSRIELKFIKEIVVEEDHPVYAVNCHLVLGYYYWLERQNIEKGMHHFQCCVRFYKEAACEFLYDHQIDKCEALCDWWKMWTTFDIQKNIGNFMKVAAGIAKILSSR